MKKIVLLVIAIAFYSKGISQEVKKVGSETLLKELAENGCKCVDSIPTYNRPKNEIAMDISDCIDKQIGAYQLGSKLLQMDTLKEVATVKDGKKQVDISYNVDENSEEYKKYYFEMERYMMSNCSSVKEKIATNEKQSAKSFSKNEKAIEYYSKGMDEVKKENSKKAKIRAKI